MLALLRGGAGAWLTGALAVLVLMAAAGAILLTLLPANDVRAGTTPTTLIRVEPASQTVSAGTDIDIEIRIDNVSNLGAYEFRLMYEPSVVQFESVADGSFLASTGRSVTCQGPLRPANTVLYGCNTIGETPDGPSGSGVLATVRLSSSCSGSSSFQLVRVTLGDILGDSEVISFETQDGSVTITGDAACSTPTPGQTATSTPAATVTPNATPTATSTPAATVTPNATPTATSTPAATVTPGGLPTATPIVTPVPTWTPVSTWTPAPTWTPEPTWTSQPLPTSTPMQLQLLVGDANCSGAVDAVDATVILQWWVGLAAVLPCPADANGDRTLSIVDATVILQFYAGMVATLPP